MKKILALSLAFSAITMSVSAQQSTTSGKSPSDQTAKKNRKHEGHGKGMKDLNMTDAQKAQVKIIREDKTLSKDARKAKMDNVFNADQKATMEKNRADHQAKRAEMHEKRAQKMQTKLGLSDDQAAKLKAQNEANHAQMKAIKDDKSLSADARKTKMSALKTQAHEQRKSVLTPGQQKKMADMKKDGKGKGKHKKMDKPAK